MSRYRVRPLDFAKLKTVGLKERGGKVKATDFAVPYAAGSGITGLLDSMPRILAGDSFRAVVEAIAKARAGKRAILWGMGGHVIKCGLAPVLLDLMRRGYATGFALNGSAAIHDFEIALAGHTSEDVEAVLPDGRFGAAEETGREMNLAIAQAACDGIGMGEGLGRDLHARAGNLTAPEHSLLLGAWESSTPVTVHVAIGTDTPHTHPAADPAAIGAATHQDFRLFSAMAAELNDGGVYLNVGSAVLLPEVFLKAVSAVRNLEKPLANFTTVNFDFLQHYRPRVNVVERPHANAGGKGYAITGHHELMIPLLAAALIENFMIPEAEPERYPFWTYMDVLLFAGLAIPCMLLGLGIVKAVFWALHLHPTVKTWELLLDQFAGYALLFGALVGIFRMQYGRPFWTSLAWTEGRLAWVWVVLAGAASVGVVSLVGTAIQTPNTSNPMLDLLKDRTSIVLIAIFGVTLGPLCEELAFRGFLQPLLVRSLGPAPGILAAALPFGLLHFQEYGNSWKHVLLITLAGATFGWMRHATGSTKAATIMHGVYNALFFVDFLAQSKWPSS